MAITIQGMWTIRVRSKNADWDQRFVIAGSDTSDGVYPGYDGTRYICDAAT